MRGKKKIFISLLIVMSLLLSPINFAFASELDTSKPYIHDVKISDDEIYYGDKVTISAKIIDESDISSVNLIVQSEYDSTKKYSMSYNSQNENYQCSVTFNDIKHIGYNYMLIEATDIYGNKETFNFYEEYYDYIYVYQHESFNKNGYGTIASTDLYDGFDFTVPSKSKQVKINIETISSKSNKISLHKIDEYDDKKIYSNSYKKNFSKTFTLKKGSYYLEIDGNEILSYDTIPFKLSISDITKYPQSGKLVSSISLKTEKSKTISLTNIYPSTANLDYISWSTSNSKILKIKGNREKCTVTAKKAGTAYVYAKLSNGKTYKTKVKVTNPAPKLKYTSRRLYKGSTCSVNLLYTKGKVTYKSSNKKIATVSSKGTIKAKSIGKCTIYAKNKGKTYKLKVSVVRQLPNFGACLYDYDTRNNVFVVKFRNKSNKTLTINSGTYKVEDVDYKYYDRKIKLKNSYKIKPNTTKYIRFKVIGSTTWYDYHDFTLHYKFTFDGKKYVGHVWDEDSVFKYGKYWYDTYDDSHWYENWIYYIY